MKGRLFVVLVAAATCFSLLPAASASAADGAVLLHLPTAILQTEADRLAYLSQPEPCRMDFAAAAGTVVVDGGVGALRAQDDATVSAECVSLDPNSQYPMSFEVVFQYYDSALGQFVDIPETRTTCSGVRVLGQSGAPCAHNYIYPFGHGSLDKIHRARARMLQPTPGNSNYSDPFITVDPSDIEPAFGIKCTADVVGGHTGEYETGRLIVKSQAFGASVVVCSGDPIQSALNGYWVHQRLTFERWNSSTRVWESGESTSCWTQANAGQAVGHCYMESVENSMQADKPMRVRLDVFAPVQMTRYASLQTNMASMDIICCE